ncbi:MAG: ABC transporter substrate binding protein [Pseudolabrys sp.]
MMRTRRVLPRLTFCPRRCSTSIASLSLSGLLSCGCLLFINGPKRRTRAGCWPTGEVFRQRARMVAKVLRGVKPADLPIEQPSTFKLSVNLKTAKSMNQIIPAALLLRADKLIE